MKAVVCSSHPWWLWAEWAGLVTHHCNTTDRPLLAYQHTHKHRVSTVLSQVYNLPLTTSQQLYKHWRIRAAKTCQHFRPAACFRTDKQTAVYKTLRSLPNQDSLFSRLTVTCFAGVLNLICINVVPGIEQRICINICLLAIALFNREIRRIIHFILHIKKCSYRCIWLNVFKMKIVLIPKSIWKLQQTWVVIF